MPDARRRVSSDRVITQQVIAIVEQATEGTERVCRKCLFPYSMDEFDLYTQDGKTRRRRTCRYCCKATWETWAEKNRHTLRRQAAEYIQRRRDTDPVYKAQMREYARRYRAEKTAEREKDIQALEKAGYCPIKVLAARYFISGARIAKLCRAKRLDAQYERQRWWVKEISLAEYLGVPPGKQ